MLIRRTRFLISSILLLTLSGAYAETSVTVSNRDFSSHIQTLAASCAACHGTNGNSVAGTPVLAGLDKSHFIMQMLAFRSGERQASVMHRHAKGLTAEEIEQLATYFSTQKRQQAVLPPSQVLKDTHGY